MDSCNRVGLHEVSGVAAGIAGLRIGAAGPGGRSPNQSSSSCTSPSQNFQAQWVLSWVSGIWWLFVVWVFGVSPLLRGVGCATAQLLRKVVLPG